MTLLTALTLFFSMVLLALIPGPGVLAVVARSLSADFRQGVSTVAGIVAGDYVFITCALLGLTALSELMGELFIIVKYLGAAYLIWLGISLARSKNANTQAKPIKEPNHLASFMAGLVTTISNPKAILFYLSFFPAFLDLSAVTVVDAALVYIIATLAVGGVMLGYAYAAFKARASYKFSKSSTPLRYGSSAILIGSGVFIAARN